MIQVLIRDVGLQKAAIGCRCDRPFRNGGLIGIRQQRDGIDRTVDGGQLLCQSRAVAGSRWSALVLRAHIECKAARGGVAAHAGVIIEPVSVGAAVVVYDTLSEVIAVAQRSATDAAPHGVHRFNRGAPSCGPQGPSISVRNCWLTAS